MLAEVRQDVKIILSVLAGTEEGKDRLEKTQKNLMNLEKSCRNCHPWIDGCIELKSDFANGVIKQMNLNNEKCSDTNQNMTKSYLKQIEKVLQEAHQ